MCKIGTSNRRTPLIDVSGGSKGMPQTDQSFYNFMGLFRNVKSIIYEKSSVHPGCHLLLVSILHICILRGCNLRLSLYQRWIHTLDGLEWPLVTHPHLHHDGSLIVEHSKSWGNFFITIPLYGCSHLNLFVVKINNGNRDLYHLIWMYLFGSNNEVWPENKGTRHIWSSSQRDYSRWRDLNNGCGSMPVWSILPS